jgi:SprT protein
MIWNKLQDYLPSGTLPEIEKMLQDHVLKMRITAERKSRLGSFKAGIRGKPHQIFITGSLNPYAFLITLVHEIAHMKNWEKNSNKVKPHGKEWKAIYKDLIAPFLNRHIFPDHLEKLLIRHNQNPNASSSTDMLLQKTLGQYDTNPKKGSYLEELPPGSAFIWNGNRIFRKEEQLRKRFKCTEVKNNRKYLFHPLAIVEPFDPETKKSILGQ